MNYNVRDMAAEISSERSQKRLWIKVLMVLAFVVAFCTTLVLINPASALESTPDDISDDVLSESDIQSEEIDAENPENETETAAEDLENETELKELNVERALASLLKAPSAELLAESDEKSGESEVSISKENEYDSKTDQYVITMEAYANGTTTDIYTTAPNDIVLLLDKSGSMAYDVVIKTETVTIGNAKTDGIDKVLSLLETDKPDGYYQIHIVDRDSINGDYYADLRYKNGKWQWRPLLRISYEDVLTHKPNDGNFGDIIISGTTEEVEKTEILRQSVIDFINRLEDDSAKTGIVHRVDIVTFDETVRHAYGFLSLTGDKTTVLIL